MNGLESRRTYYGALFVGILIFAAVIVICVNLGVADISLGETLRIIGGKIPFLREWLGRPVCDTKATIVLTLRFPRILLAALTGAGLAVSGATAQGIFKNPMADPYCLGISSGAALGAALALTLNPGMDFLGLSMTTVSAFLGAIGAALLVYNIARIGNKLSDVTLLLTGIAVNFLATALISLVMTFRREQMERIVMWTMGSVSTASWLQVVVVAPVVILAVVGLTLFARNLNLLLLGDESAQNLGLEVGKAKKRLLTVSTFTVAAVVSVSGIIGFIGLVVPHMVRMLFGPDHRAVIPFSALGGAILLIVCDTLARTLVPPSEIPLGIVTALFGVPFFLYLIVRQKRKG